jgi:hypothetical protein
MGAGKPRQPAASEYGHWCLSTRLQVVGVLWAERRITGARPIRNDSARWRSEKSVGVTELTDADLMARATHVGS